MESNLGRNSQSKQGSNELVSVECVHIAASYPGKGQVAIGQSPQKITLLPLLIDWSGFVHRSSAHSLVHYRHLYRSCTAQALNFSMGFF